MDQICPWADLGLEGISTSSLEPYLIDLARGLSPSWKFESSEGLYLVKDKKKSEGKIEEQWKSLFAFPLH